MKKFLAGILCVIMMVCMLPTVEVSAAGEDAIVEIGETGVISSFEQLQEKLGAVADFESIDENTIKMTMTSSVKGRIQFDNMSDKKIIIDANGKTFDGGGASSVYNEPICVDNACFNVTLELTGNGTYIRGKNNVLYSSGSVIIKNATMTGRLFVSSAVVVKEEGYDCYLIRDKATGDLIEIYGEKNFVEEMPASSYLYDTTKTYVIEQHNHTYGDDGKCDTCENEKIAPTYTIIEGANANYTQGTDKAITVRADGDFAKFTGVKVNGSLLDAKYYTAVSGSTVVTLTQEYLDTLSEGTYEMTVVFTDGECSTNFQIKKEVQADTQPAVDTNTNNTTNNETTSPSINVAASPKTGDSSMLYMVMLVMGVLVYSVKRVDKCRK